MSALSARHVTKCYDGPDLLLGSGSCLPYRGQGSGVRGQRSEVRGIDTCFIERTKYCDLVRVFREILVIFK